MKFLAKSEQFFIKGEYMIGRKPVYLLILALTLITLIVIFGGCSRTIIYEPMEYSDGEHYKTCTLSESNIHFSYEYPVLDFFNDEDIAYITRDGSEIGKGAAFGTTSYDILSLFVIYWCKDEILSNINDAVKDKLAWIKEEEWHSDFKLLEKRKVQVSGFNGIELLYSYKAYVYPGDLLSFVERVIFFSNDDLIWEVDCFSETSIVDQANTEFEHVVRTFRFLD